MDRQEFVKQLRIATQSILNRTFSERGKRRLKVKYSSINFACPYCGDSATDNDKKRGNLIIAGNVSGFYKCFNCGHFTNANQFFRDNNVQISDELKTELDKLSENLNSNKQKDSLNLSVFTASKEERHRINVDLSLIDLVYDLDVVEKYAVDKATLFNNRQFKIIPVTQSEIAMNYLRSRHQDYPVNYPKFGYIPSQNAIAIFNLTMNGNILGFQTRFLDPNVTNRYRTYKTSRIHDYVLGNQVKVPPKIDTISTMFNIMLVDFNRPIITLEGPFDSMLIPNSIATSSSSIDPPQILDPYYYMYDSDKTGNSKALKKLQKGEYVFLWGKLKDDYNMPQQNKLDWNQFHTWLKENDKTPPKDLLEYFSNNQLDAMML